jgi:hypothetical protein
MMSVPPQSPRNEVSGATPYLEDLEHILHEFQKTERRFALVEFAILIALGLGELWVRTH